MSAPDISPTDEIRRVRGLKPPGSPNDIDYGCSRSQIVNTMIGEITL
jgi:hypothetical protein